MCLALYDSGMYASNITVANVMVMMMNNDNDDFDGNYNHKILYSKARADCIKNFNHVNIVADGAIHSKHDTIVSLLWCWEKGEAVCGNIQQCFGGKYILPDECEMSEECERLIAGRKHERWAAFRQLQAVANIIRTSTNEKMELDDFQLPRGCDVGPVGPDEQYVVRPGMYRDEAFKLKTVNGVKTHRPVLADDGLEDIKLCMLSLDQGSIGSAGVAFRFIFAVHDSDASI